MCEANLIFDRTGQLLTHGSKSSGTLRL